MTFSKNLISVSIIIAGLIVAGALVYVFSVKGGMSQGALPKDIAVQKAIDYINKNLLGGTTEAVLKESSEVGALYKFKIQIGDQEYESYISKDGKLLFPEGIVLEEKSKEEKKADTTQEITKRERPDVKLFVMSYCPFGLQAEKAFLPVYDLLSDKADMGIYFVDYIMHDKKEMDENVRQYCLQKEEPAKFSAYLSCFTKKGEYQACLDSSQVDQQKLSSCMAAADKEFNVSKNYNNKSSWRGGRFPEFEVHGDLNKKYGVQGSPTLVINDKVVTFERSPEGLKKLICQAFSSPPSACSQTLSDASPSSGFGGGEKSPSPSPSPSGGSGSGSGSGGGSCQ